MAYNRGIEKSLLHLYFLTYSPPTFTYTPTVEAHVDPFFAEAEMLDLHKVLHSSNNFIPIVKIATTELLLHLGEEVAV